MRRKKLALVALAIAIIFLVTAPAVAAVVTPSAQVGVVLPGAEPYSIDKLLGFLQKILGWLMAIGGLLALIAVAVIGIKKLFTHDPRAIADQRHAIVNIIIGIALIFGAYVFVGVIRGLVETLG